MIQRSSILIGFIIFLFLLFGCGQRDVLKVHFYNYSFQIHDDSNDWVCVSPSVLGEKQIIKKIEKVYRKKNDNIDIIISKIYIKNKQISSKEFILANIERFKELIGYKLMNLDFFNLKCKDIEVKVGVHKFKIDQSFLGEKRPTYYVGQFYLYDGNYGYVIQILGKDKGKINDYVDNIKNTLSCR